jgi:hypothetical protein
LWEWAFRDRRCSPDELSIAIMQLRGMRSAGVQDFFAVSVQARYALAIRQQV